MSAEARINWVMSLSADTTYSEYCCSICHTTLRLTNKEREKITRCPNCGKPFINKKI